MGKKKKKKKLSVELEEPTVMRSLSDHKGTAAIKTLKGAAIGVGTGSAASSLMGYDSQKSVIGGAVAGAVLGFIDATVTSYENDKAAHSKAVELLDELDSVFDVISDKLEASASAKELAHEIAKAFGKSNDDEEEEEEEGKNKKGKGKK